MQLATAELPGGELASAGQEAQAAAADRAKSGEYLPALHAVQAADPTADLYVPGRQALHSLAFRPV